MKARHHRNGLTSQIEVLTDWRGGVLSRIRELVLGAYPGISEEWKWGTAVWSYHGLLCSAAAFKDHVKIHFFQGAFLEDAHGLFNAGLDGNKMRAIDFREGQAIDEPGLKELVRVAVTFNEKNSQVVDLAESLIGASNGKNRCYRIPVPGRGHGRARLVAALLE